jgi:hypothetical protein
MTFAARQYSGARYFSLDDHLIELLSPLASAQARPRKQPFLPFIANAWAMIDKSIVAIGKA